MSYTKRLWRETTVYCFAFILFLFLFGASFIPWSRDPWSAGHAKPIQHFSHHYARPSVRVLYELCYYEEELRKRTILLSRCCWPSLMRAWSERVWFWHICRRLCSNRSSNWQSALPFCADTAWCRRRSTNSMHIRLYTCHSATLIAVIRKRSNTRQKWDNYQTLVQGRRHQILIGGGGGHTLSSFFCAFRCFFVWGGRRPRPNFLGGAAAPPAPLCWRPCNVWSRTTHVHVHQNLTLF